MAKTDSVTASYDPVDIAWVDTAEQALGTGSALRGKDSGRAGLVAPDPALAARFLFRPWLDHDAELYAQMLSNPDLWRFMYEPYPDPMTPDLARSLITFSREAAHHKVRAVEWDGQVVGQVRLQWDTHTTPPQRAEVSYWLARSYWGKRLAAPMVALECWRAFSLFPALQDITAFVHRDNLPSHRLLQRIGFKTTRAHPERPDWQGYQLLRAQGIGWAQISLPR